MSPEQTRGQLTDSRTDLFSLGTVLYQMATGLLPFQGDTSAVVYEAILNRDPVPITLVNPILPPAFARIVEKALEKDRNLRYQTATDLKTDLIRLKRDIDSGHKRAADSAESRTGVGKASAKSVAVLYFENLSRARSEEHTSELQSHHDLVCRLLLEKKKNRQKTQIISGKIEQILTIGVSAASG